MAVMSEAAALRLAPALIHSTEDRLDVHVESVGAHPGGGEVSEYASLRLYKLRRQI